MCGMHNLCTAKLWYTVRFWALPDKPGTLVCPKCRRLPGDATHPAITCQTASTQLQHIQTEILPPKQGQRIRSNRKALTRVALHATVKQLRIRNFVHKGLKRLYAEGSSKGLPPDAVDKLRKMLSFLQDIEDQDELRAIAVWKAHLLKGDRKGIWSLHVTRNWRLTFRIDTEEGEVLDVDLEDYH